MHNFDWITPMRSLIGQKRDKTSIVRVRDYAQLQAVQSAGIHVSNVSSFRGGWTFDVPRKDEGAARRILKG